MTTTLTATTTPSPYLMVRPLLMISSLAILGMFLGGCATSSRIMVGQSRAPIDPASVKIYLTPPERYEEVAMITVDSDNSWTFSQQAKMEKVIERLKIEAASVGANGVLIRNIGDRSEDPVIITDEDDDWSTGFAISDREKTAWAVAIYVPEESDGPESLLSILGRRSPWGQSLVANVD